MGAHNTATLDYATRRAAWVATHMGNGQASREWANTISAALDQPTGGTIKSWFDAHAEDSIDTFQIVLKLSGADVVDARSLWASPSRRVTRRGATYVELDESRRDFGGVTTLTSGDVYLGFAKWGDDAVQMIVYRVS